MNELSGIIIWFAEVSQTVGPTLLLGYDPENNCTGCVITMEVWEW